MSEWDDVTDWLREHHRVTVGGNVRWAWSCSCGKRGLDTTQGRAIAGRDRHLQAQRAGRRRQLAEARP